MQIKKLKTVRFDVLIKESGRPEQIILWTPPEKNPPFRKAIRENRVLTIIQPNVGTKKDFGVVGFIKERNVAFFLFPKPLKHEHGTKIIGIKYERLAK